MCWTILLKRRHMYWSAVVAAVETYIHGGAGGAGGYRTKTVSITGPSTLPI